MKNCEMTIQGAESLALGLYRNMELKSLVLSHNHLTDIGVLKIVESILDNFSYQICHLEL